MLKFEKLKSKSET